MKIDILGSQWTIEHKYAGEDNGLNGLEGYTDRTSRRIVLAKHRPAQDKEVGALDDMADNDRNTTRHELTHAFLFESGLDNYSQDEDLVTWLAHQFPKMMRAFAFAGALESADIEEALDKCKWREEYAKFEEQSAAVGYAMLQEAEAKGVVTGIPTDIVQGLQAGIESTDNSLTNAAQAVVAKATQAIQEGLKQQDDERSMVQAMYDAGAVVFRAEGDAQPMTIDEVMQHIQASKEVEAVDKREAVKEEDRFMQEYQPDPNMSVLEKSNYEVNGLKAYIDEHTRRRMLNEASRMITPGRRLEVERMLIYQQLAQSCSQHELVSVFNTAVMTSKITADAKQ